MAFYIVQHGISLTKDLDPEKGLSSQGIENSDSPAIKWALMPRVK
jgi:hypothetical protein